MYLDKIKEMLFSRRPRANAWGFLVAKLKNICSLNDKLAFQISSVTPDTTTTGAIQGAIVNYVEHNTYRTKIVFVILYAGEFSIPAKSEVKVGTINYSANYRAYLNAVFLTASGYAGTGFMIIKDTGDVYVYSDTALNNLRWIQAQGEF